MKVKALIGEWYYAVVDSHAGYIHRTDVTISSSAVAGMGMLKQGMKGEEVMKLQRALYRYGRAHGQKLPCQALRRLVPCGQRTYNQI